MISNFGRVMTVLVAMFSVAFLSFAISRWATIPDWVTEARKLEQFRLNRTEGETPTWSAVTRRGEQPIPNGTSTNIADVLEKMYKHATTEAQEKQRKLDESIPLLEQDIQAANAAVAADKVGVQNRVDELVARLEQMEEEVNRITTESEREKALAQSMQQERERRRGDVFRLREELGELQTDTYRAEELQQELTDMIRRVQGSVIKLQTRQTLLQQSLQ